MVHGFLTLGESPVFCRNVFARGLKIGPDRFSRCLKIGFHDQRIILDVFHNSGRDLGLDFTGNAGRQPLHGGGLRFDDVEVAELGVLANLFGLRNQDPLLIRLRDIGKFPLLAHADVELGCTDDGLLGDVLRTRSDQEPAGGDRHLAAGRCGNAAGPRERLHRPLGAGDAPLEAGEAVADAIDVAGSAGQRFKRSSKQIDRPRAGRELAHDLVDALTGLRELIELLSGRIEGPEIGA